MQVRQRRAKLNSSTRNRCAAAPTRNFSSIQLATSNSHRRAAAQLSALNRREAAPTRNPQLATSTRRKAAQLSNLRPAAFHMSKIDNFEDLECYKAARFYRRNLARWARSLPKEETYRMKDQVIRSARSVTANIAEGFGRHHPQENLQFCRQARGSLMETLDHLNAAIDEDLIDQDSYETFRKEWTEVRNVLNGYIRYLTTLAPKDRRFMG